MAKKTQYSGLGVWENPDSQDSNFDFSYMFQNPSGRQGSFDRLRNWYRNFKSGNTGTGTKSGGFFAPGANAKFSSFANKATNPQFSWSKASGLKGWGKNLGTGFNVANALYQGYNAVEGLSSLSDAQDTTSDIVSDIVTASYSNPMLVYDLNTDQRNMLRQLRRGTYGTEAGYDDIDWLGVLGDAVKGGFMGIGGGIPGMIAGAVGGGGNAIIDDLNQAQGMTNSELEALYQAIMESEQSYNDLKKQRAYNRLAQY